MNTLKLTLNKEWFDLIEQGIKTEEYREVKRFWIVRLLSNIEYLTDLEGVKNVGARFRKYDYVEFTNGYSKSSRQITFEFVNLLIGQGLSEWGAVKGQEYFIIKLGREVGRQYYR
jgi:hypothetical protein